MATVEIKDDEIRLNSSLDEISFGKTKYFTLLSEKGMFFDGENFSPWSFDKINAFEIENNVKEVVFYCGHNILSNNAKTLLTYFNENKNSDELFNAAFLVITAMTKAALNKITLPRIGAGGIIVDTDTNKVLFLPEDIFEYSTNVLSEEEHYNENTGWINNTITDLPALCYQRAIITYKLLTGSLPYTATDEAERNADILDKNFLPIDQCIEGIDKDFAKSLNKSLRIISTSISIPGKRKKGIRSEDVKVKIDFDLEKLKEAWELKKSLNITDEDISQKTSSYIKSHKTGIKAKRNFRRNTAIIIGLVCVAIAVIIFSVTSAKKQNEKFTALGLTSEQAVQSFFYGVNTKNMPLLELLTDGTTPDDYVENVKQVFLLEKQLMGFTRDGLYQCPENWLFSITDDDRYYSTRVYGTTNLKINDEPRELDVKIYRRKDDPSPITKENGKYIEPADSVTYKVDYYVVTTNPADYSIFVQKCSDKFVVTYINERWIITDIFSDKEEIDVDTEQFKQDYFKQLELNDQDMIKATAALKDKYEWLPTNKAMEIALQKLL